MTKLEIDNEKKKRSHESETKLSYYYLAVNLSLLAYAVHQYDNSQFINGTWFLVVGVLLLLVSLALGFDFHERVISILRAESHEQFNRDLKGVYSELAGTVNKNYAEDVKEDYLDSYIQLRDKRLSNLRSYQEVIIQSEQNIVKQQKIAFDLRKRNYSAEAWHRAALYFGLLFLTLYKVCSPPSPLAKFIESEDSLSSLAPSLQSNPILETSAANLIPVREAIIKTPDSPKTVAVPNASPEPSPSPDQPSPSHELNPVQNQQ
jgi:hypothetical protein